LIRFLQIARSSASEVEYHLLLARDLKFLSVNAHRTLEKRLQEVQRMLTAIVSMIQGRTDSSGVLASPRQHWELEAGG
jgi:four helix bundle protein